METSCPTVDQPYHSGGRTQPTLCCILGSVGFGTIPASPGKPTVAQSLKAASLVWSGLGSKTAKCGCLEPMGCNLRIDSTPHFPWLWGARAAVALRQASDIHCIRVPCKGPRV